jgi:hypothetical protein
VTKGIPSIIASDLKPDPEGPVNVNGPRLVGAGCPACIVIQGDGKVIPDPEVGENFTGK